MAAARIEELQKLLRERGLGKALPKLEAPALPAAPTGRVELDRRLGGGLPRGAVSELIGPESSGRTSLLLGALAQATAADELVAYVDATDALDPRSALAAGVTLERMLWVRCEARQPERWRRALRQAPAESAWQAANLVAAAGGFGVVAVDLGGLSIQRLEQWRRLPWVRLRQAVEHGSTALVVLAERHVAGSAATLTLDLERESGARGVLLADVADVRVHVRQHRAARQRLTA